MSDYKKDKRYNTFKYWGIFLGLVSLSSFWIVVGLAYLLYPLGIIGENHYGALALIYFNIPTMLVLAIGGKLGANRLRARARARREELTGTVQPTNGKQK